MAVCRFLCSSNNTLCISSCTLFRACRTSIVSIRLIALVILLFGVCINGKAIAKKSIHKKALAQSPHLRAGIEAFKQKEYKSAKDLFRTHIRQHKKDFDSWNYLAASYYHLGHTKESTALLKVHCKKD